MFRRVGDDWVLFDPRTEQMHVLNLTSALVWSHLTGDAIEDVARAVVSAYPEPVPQGADGSVLRAIEEFASRGLIELGESHAK